MTESRPARARRGVGSWLRIGFIVIALVLAGLALVHDGRAAAHDIARIGPVRLVGSGLLAIAGLAASAQAWRALLAGVGEPLAVPEAADVFFVGQLGKYLPGSIFAVVGQVQRAAGAGVSRVAVGTTALLAMVMNIASGSLVAVGLLSVSGTGAVGHHPELLVALPVGLALLAPPVLNPLLGRLLRLVRRPPLPQRLGAGPVAAALGWSLLMWACYGLHLWLLTDGVGASGHRTLLLCAGGYAFAWVVGFLLVIAPAGIGVREAALTLVLAPVLASPAALAVSFASRLLMTVGDLLCAALAAGCLRLTQNARPGAPARVFPAVDARSDG